MKDSYTKLMVQQHTVNDAAFFEKLEQAQPKKRMHPMVRAAVAVVCLCLLIPVTVYAVNLLTHNAQITESHDIMKTDKKIHSMWEFRYVNEIPTDDYAIDFGNLNRFSIKKFPRNVRKANSLAVHYDSWEQAVKDLDVGYLNNTLLADVNTEKKNLRVAYTFNEEPTHCMMEYVGLDDQPFLAYLHANYERDDIEFTIQANIGIEHPTALEEYYELLHRHGSGMPHRYRPKYEHESYTTANGIPVIITKTTTSRGTFSYAACLAVNNISYSINIGEWSFSPSTGEKYDTPEEKVRATLLEVLEGFTLE